MNRKLFDILRKERGETRRWMFWAWMMDNRPKMYKWCEKHLTCDTLPF